MGKPRERRETGEQDLFRARLDQILNMNHELVRLARAIDWEERPHQGRWCFGKTPMQTFLDAKPLAKEKMIAA